MLGLALLAEEVAEKTFVFTGIRVSWLERTGEAEHAGACRVWVRCFFVRPAKETFSKLVHHF